MKIFLNFLEANDKTIPKELSFSLHTAVKQADTQHQKETECFLIWVKDLVVLFHFLERKFLGELWMIQDTVLSRLSHPIYVPSIFSKECCRFSCDTLTTPNLHGNSWGKTHKCIQSSHNMLGSVLPFLLHQFPTFLVLSNDTWRLGAIAATGAASLCAAICKINQDLELFSLIYHLSPEKAMGQLPTYSCATELLSQVRDNDSKLLHIGC